MLAFVLGTGACNRAMSPWQREVDVVARFVEARLSCDEPIHVSHLRHVHRSSLSPKLYSSGYIIEQCGQTWELGLWCNEGPEISDKMMEGWTPRCVAIGHPAIDQSIPSRLAPEFIALFAHLRTVLRCSFDTFTLTRNSGHGTADYLVKSCDGDHRITVECETFDASEATRRCRVTDR